LKKLTEKASATKELEELLRRELFHIVPFGIAVINRKMEVVTANRNFEEYFGEWRNRNCYAVCKGRSGQCDNCQAVLTFKDGKTRVSDETGVDRRGRTCHYVVHVAPLPNAQGEVQYVVEMTTDVTETRLRQREYNLLFERVPCFITVIDRNYRIVRANEKFRRTFGDPAGGFCYNAYKMRSEPCPDCPAALTFQDGVERVTTQTGVARDGKETHYVVTTAPLSRGAGEVAHVIEISADITPIKVLEKEKLEAERLGAVGQTVAGLAHTIKNLLMGLEGGMYMVDSGLRRGNSDRIAEGWEVLQRNFNKTVSLVKDFLSFAKGRLPVLKKIHPNRLAGDIVELYRDAAAKQGVRLALEAGPEVRPALLDPDGMEACLTNLVSNGIDAAMMRDQPGAEVVVRTREEGDTLIFEVADNGCGMDWEVKQQVFTTFFTTKASRGTGLGLLTTRKIVQEHGGTIEVESEPGAGSVFCIRLPRERLKAIAAQAKNAALNEKTPRRKSSPNDGGGETLHGVAAATSKKE
jgi:PAS domain S-box-containing protein